MVRQFANIRQASNAAAEYILECAGHAVMAKGFFTVVLAGGSTPRLTYEILSEPANALQMLWQQTHFFWGDERWVAETHPDSNYAMAQRVLLSKIPVPPQNIHRITTGHTSPEIAAEVYEKHLRDFFFSRPMAGMKDSATGLVLPCFDLVLLGMGSDGHTASLFPGTGQLEEHKKWVTSVREGTGTPPVPRITLTLPVFNGAKNILFLISGNEKRKILDTIITRPAEAAERYPAARIKPAGKLIWLAA